MRNLITNSVAFSLLWLASHSIACGAVVPLKLLRNKADIVALATIKRITTGAAGVQTIELQAQRVLKGQIASSTISVELVPPSDPRYDFSGGLLSPSAAGRNGIWFLKMGVSGYEVLPLATNVFTPNDIFLPVGSALLSTSLPGEIDQQLLQYVIQWYLSVPNPTPSDERRLLSNLDAANPQYALPAVDALIGSPSIPHHVVGLAAAIRMGSDSALSTVAKEISSLRSSPKFFYICRAIGLYYKPHNESSISVLKQLVDLHSSAPGLDDAVASALRKIGTKDIVPVVAELLDSQDPQAQLRAASFFGFYSLFADAKGDVVQGNLVKGPFATADTRQYTPRSGSSLTPSQYASFWKTWWLQNSSRLGFAAQ